MPPTGLFLNLPTKDLPRATKFFNDIGFAQNMQFSNDDASGFQIGEQMFLMVLAEPFFQTFTKKAVSDARGATEAIFSLGMESRDEVDRFVDTAMSAGASPSNDPMDHGFMYTRSFQDPDGHLWEVFWMDQAQVQG